MLCELARKHIDYMKERKIVTLFLEELELPGAHDLVLIHLRMAPDE